MSSSPKKELHDGGYPPISSYVQVVEVVEMKDAGADDIQKTGGEGISRGFGFKTEGKQITQFKAQFDKGERERKVSKYQSKKKVKSAAISSNEPQIKQEILKEDTVAPTEHRTESNTSDSNSLNETIQISASSVDSGSMLNDCSSDVEFSGAMPMDLDDQLEEELLYGDGEDCIGLSAAEDDLFDDHFVEQSQETDTQSLQGDYEEISNDSASEDSEDNEDAAHGRMATSGSKAETFPRVALANSGAKGPSKVSIELRRDERPDTVAPSSPRQKREACARNASPNTRQMKTSRTSVSTSSPVKRKDLVISPIQSPWTDSAMESSVKPPDSTRFSSERAQTHSQPLVSAGSRMDKESPLLSASGHSEAGMKRTVVSSPKGVGNEGNQRRPVLSGHSSKKVAKSAGKVDSFMTLDVTYTSHSSSSLLSQLDGPLMEREILPGIQTSGHLGLSSHSGTDWDVEQRAEINAEEDDEDMDVLSLYEYDTFLESEEEPEDRGHGTGLSIRSIGCATIKSNGGEGGLHLKPEENLSISVLGKSERRVSRPSSKERNENEREVQQQDSEEKDETVRQGKEKNASQSPQHPQVRLSRSSKPDREREPPIVNDDHKFQKPLLPAPKMDKRSNQAYSKPSPLPVKGGLQGKPTNVPQRRQADGRNDVYRQASFPLRGGMENKRRAPRQPQKTQDMPPFQRNQQLRLEEIQKELEAELKHFLEQKRVFDATETVGKIHGQESMKVDGGLVLNLLHLLIREGAVPQLMKVFTFVCNQGLFNSEVCNAYIRLGCAEGGRYDRQLKNVFQYLRRHSIQPAGDCVLALLSLYSEDSSDGVMFWLMLSYFDTFPGFLVPVPLLERALGTLLQHKERSALARFNQWVLTTKAESVLQKLDLALVGRMAPSMLPASLARLQKVITTAQEEKTDELKDLPSPPDTTLVLPSNFSDQDYLFYSRRIQACGGAEGMDRLAQVYVEVCRCVGHNRPLLKDYAQVLLQTAVVGTVDTFLHCLYDALQQERGQGAGVDPDDLALAHLCALLLEHTCFSHPPDTTLRLLTVVTQCPLVVTTLMMNCRDVGYKVITLCLKAQQPLRALDLMKAQKLRKSEEQGSSLVPDMLQQLVAGRDLAAAVTALKVATVQQAMGIADLGVLASQLMWHALDTCHIPVALDLLEVAQRRQPPHSLPAALLRALLVACWGAGFRDQAAVLFDDLKHRRVYNVEPLGTRPNVFQLSSMLTPTEVRFCVLDRLKELHDRLVHQVKSGVALVGMDRGVGVKVVSEHDARLLALPFLALAPRSMEQALTVLTLELTRLAPPLRADFNPHINLMVLEPAALVTHLNTYPCPGLKQGLVWADEEPHSSPPPVHQPPSLPFPGGSGGGRHLSPSPPPALPPSRLQGPSGRQLPAGCPQPPGGMEVVVSRPALPPLPRPGGPQEQSAAQPAPSLPFRGRQDWGGAQLPMSRPAPHSFPEPADCGEGRYVPEPQRATRLHHGVVEVGGRERSGPSRVVQPSFQQVDCARMMLPAPSHRARPPYQPQEPVPIPGPGDAPQSAYQPNGSTGRQFPEVGNVTRPHYQPMAEVEKQAAPSVDGGARPAVRGGNGAGRQLSVPSPFTPQSSQRRMKRRLSAPPDHQPAVAHNQPFKTPLLPTPKFHPDQQPAMPGGQLSQKSPPKKRKMSPSKQPFTRGRGPATVGRQQHQSQRPPASQMSQPPVSRDTRQLQQPARGRREMPSPSDRYRDQSQFCELIQIPDGQLAYSSRDFAQLPPRSSPQVSEPSQQNSPGIRQPQRPFPGDSTGRLPLQSAQSKVLPQWSTKQSSWQEPEHNTHAIGQSQQPFSGRGDQFPSYPPRFDEQSWNPPGQMREKEQMMQEVGPQDRSHWQDRTGRFGQQQPGAQPWGDAPQYGEIEDPWLSRPSGEGVSPAPAQQARQPFSQSDTAPHPFNQASVREPVGRLGALRGAARGRGRSPVRGGNQWKTSFRPPRGFRGQLA